MGTKKYQIEIPSEFYKKYVAKFDTEKDAIDYLELCIDTIARSHRTLIRKHKEKQLETIKVDLHIHDFLSDIFDQYCALKRITPRHIAMKTMDKTIRKK